MIPGSKDRAGVSNSLLSMIDGYGVCVVFVIQRLRLEHGAGFLHGQLCGILEGLKFFQLKKNTSNFVRIQ